MFTRLVVVMTVVVAVWWSSDVT